MVARSVSYREASDETDAESCKPFAMIVGANDPLLTKGDNAIIMSMEQLTSISQIEGVRHFPMIEAADLVASVITKDLTRHGSSRLLDFSG